ncbi:MAG: twin-arginine translocation signal domain-containing protein [Eggerthellaceae bacterium]
MNEGISRRNFLTGAAFAGVAAAGAGLVGCSPSQGGGEGASGSEAAATGEARYEWEIAPEPITDIAKTVDTDILLSVQALPLRNGMLCENGGKVTVVGKPRAEMGVAAIGAINSRYMDELGIKVDNEREQQWIAQGQEAANEDLIVVLQQFGRVVTGCSTRWRP